MSADLMRICCDEDLTCWHRKDFGIEGLSIPFKLFEKCICILSFQIHLCHNRNLWRWKIHASYPDYLPPLKIQLIQKSCWIPICNSEPCMNHFILYLSVGGSQTASLLLSLLQISGIMFCLHNAKHYIYLGDLQRCHTTPDLLFLCSEMYS